VRLACCAGARALSAAPNARPEQTEILGAESQVAFALLLQQSHQLRHKFREDLAHEGVLFIHRRTIAVP
jgi:hypothetical protein